MLLIENLIKILLCTYNIIIAIDCTKDKAEGLHTHMLEKLLNTTYVCAMDVYCRSLQARLIDDLF